MAADSTECVLFDFGYTLFAHDPLADTVVAAAAEVGLQIPVARAASIASRIDQLAAASPGLARARDLDGDEWAAQWSSYYSHADDGHPGLGKAIYRSMHAATEWRPYRHTREVLAGLHERGVQVGIISNTGWDIRPVLAAADVAQYVGQVTLSYEVGLVKPDPAIFARCCRELGSKPGRTLMVGDDPRKDAGAVSVGIRTLLLPPVGPGDDNGLLAVLGLVDAPACEAASSDDPRA